jgi:hypothetical protein
MKLRVSSRGEGVTMKRFVIFFVVFCAGGLAGAAAQAGTVDVSFVYTRQSGSGSNQFALWIEDVRGRYVKTLYATFFTAQGGWRKREQSLPAWVKKSGLSDMGKSEIDALSGSTPSEGRLNYRWDGTDAKGAVVPSGEYRLCLEASLRGENRVLYSAVVRLGGEGGAAVVTTEYFGAGTAERGMIGGVSVRYGS